MHVSFPVSLSGVFGLSLGHKKQKVQDVGTSRGDAGSDDDFVDPPPEFGGRPRNYSEEHREASPELELTPDEDQMFPTVETRGSIKVLYNVIKSLNGRQRRAVRDIGFVGLLSLDIKETPLRLGRWLLTNYNPMDRVLNLENGNAIHIRTEDVADVFGFPMGSIPMVKRRKRELGPMLVEWRENLGKPDGNISPKNVCDAMLEQRDGGEWFRRHFSVIVATTLIECSGNGTVNQQFLELLDDVADIGDLNWCECLLESLGECHTPWSEGRVQKFVGPIDFLTLLYCDRVRWGTRFGPRNYPALKNWSSQLMKTRQFEEIRTAGFDIGELLPPLRPGVNHRAPQPTRADQGDDAARVTDPTSLGQARGVPTNVSQVQQDSMPGEAADVPILNRGQCQPNPGGGGHQHGSGVPQSSVERVMEKARLVVVSVLEFVQAVEEATRDSVVDDNLKQVLGATQKLLGLCKHGSPTVHVPDHVEVEPTFTQQEDAIWDNLDFIRGVEEIERAIQRREALKDMPSFSLGLTPPDQGVGWADMNANAPEHQVDGHAECAGGDGTADAVPLEGTAVSEASLVVGFLHGYYLAIWGVDLAAGRMPSSDVVGVEIFITPQPQVGVSSPVVDEGAGERGVLAEPLKGLMPDIEGREIIGISRQLLAEYISTSPDRRSSLSGFMCVLWSWVFDRSNLVMDEELWSYKERSAVWEDFGVQHQHAQKMESIINYSPENQEPERPEHDLAGIGRSYDCVYCKRGFNTAQALGGHMNIHRKDRAARNPKPNDNLNNDETSFNPNKPAGGRENNNNNNFYTTLNVPMFFHHQVSAPPPSQMSYQTHFPATTSGPVFSDNRYYRYNALGCDDGDGNNNPQCLNLFENDWRLSLRHVDDVVEKIDDSVDLELRLGHDYR
nr:uncharacterized protein LOC109155364 [Ipomoea batatas]